MQLRADALRDVFITRIWEQKIKEAVKRAIDRAATELKGRPLSVALLSGGSANIRWLKPLIERDLAKHTENATILEIAENYQEVVAKGLAVECARQFYTDGDGDFGAVTYNRLNLALCPDDKSVEICGFQPLVDGLPAAEDDGTLLPSATSLRAFIDKPMRWKVRMQSAPRRHLGYFFLKSSFDPNDRENLHNFLHSIVQTPRGAGFGQSIEVELTVREDGTATPVFVYGRGKPNETNVTGNPFYLDMTFAGEEHRGSSYVGLDFGTATSAISYVTRTDITAYNERSTRQEWLDLNELVHDLPYCISNPLVQYIVQTDAGSFEKCGRTAFEAMLTFITYASCCDLVACGRANAARVFTPVYRRSADPLKHSIMELAKLDQSGTLISANLLRVASDEFYEDLDRALTGLAKAKHNKRSDVDCNHILSYVGNVIRKALEGKFIGRFESLGRRAFGSGYSGTFRSFRGANPPFIDLFSYEGPHDFRQEYVVLVAELAGLRSEVEAFIRGDAHMAFFEGLVLRSRQD